MIKIRYIVFFALLTCFIFTLFQVKFKVQMLNKQMTELKQQLSREKDAIYVLKAEWAYLNQPERLERLSMKFLNLSEIKPCQINPGLSEKKIPSKQDNRGIIRTSYSATKWRYKERPDVSVKK
jgi:hypothetical protein